MPGGRPPKGPELVEALEGSPEAKERLRVILETVAERKSIAAACAKLGIGEAMFHKLRERALRAAVGGLEPRAPGRPPKEEAAEPGQVEELQREVRELKRALQAARVREEIALAMPWMLKKERSAGKKMKK
jgi:transposase-like protein